MSNVVVYLSSGLFALLLFPVHISDYIYADTNERYLSLNVCIYRYIKLFNVNSVKDEPNHMMVNGRDKEIEFKTVKANIFGIARRIQLLKFIQLGDYGLLTTGGAYAALVQNTATTAIYNFILYSGHYAKLKNYTVLDQTREGVRFYSKMEITINALTLANIVVYLISEKIK